MGAIRLIDELYPAQKDVYAIIASETDVNPKWYALAEEKGVPSDILERIPKLIVNPKPYIKIPVLFWGVTAIVIPEKGRSNDNVVPFVRYQKMLEDATQMAGYAGLCMPGDNPDVFIPAIMDWREAMIKAHLEAEKKEKEKTSLLMN